MDAAPHTPAHPYRRRRRFGVSGVFALGVLLAAPGTSRAMRPFDGTDAAVPEEGEFELELGPSYGVAARSQQWTMPGAGFNFGIASDWELSVDVRDVGGIDRAGTEAATSFESELHLKSIVRRGCLQGRTGPSIAAEFGTFIPGEDASRASAGGVSLIVSEELDLLTLHLNLEVARDSTATSTVTSSLIISGPDALRLRPVAELSTQHELGRSNTYGALAGAILQATDVASFDAAFRGTLTDGGEAGAEVRLGLTWQTSLWRAKRPSAPSESETAYP